MMHHAMDSVRENIAVLTHFLEQHANVLVLTGAGISTASGIPDYRDQNGIRRGKAPLEGETFRTSEIARKRYWARSMVGWPRLAQAQPNAAHLAISTLQTAQKISSVITQNVDGLHQQANNTNIIELHGNIHIVFCLDCGTRFPRSLIQSLLQQANPHFTPYLTRAMAETLPDGDADIEPEAVNAMNIPPCPHCGGKLQPDVVFFGDGVPHSRIQKAEQAFTAADAILVISSSLFVLSGYRLCRMAAEKGKPIAAINHGITRADHLLSFKSTLAAERILPLLVKSLNLHQNLQKPSHVYR